MKLKDKADVRIAKPSEFGIRQVENIFLAVIDCAFGRAIQRAQKVQQRAFACAGRPDNRDHLAGMNREVDFF